MPPVQAGMEPSALPAFSPPKGVRSAPRRAGSAAASAIPEDRRLRTEDRRSFVFMGAGGGLEGVLQGGGDVIAVADEVVAAGAREVHVAELTRPGVLEGEVGAEGDGLAAVQEVA